MLNQKITTARVLSTTTTIPEQLYSHAKTGTFIQLPPELHNPFDNDPMLARILQRWLPAKVTNNLLIIDDI